MKKLLPKFFILLLILSYFLGLSPTLIHSQVTPTQQPTIAPTPSGIPDDSWVIDKEVTFVGKNAARSGLLLDWTLQDYKWANIEPGSQNPLISFWVTIRNIVYALFVLFVITTAFILITTRGRSLAAKRFLPRFIVIVLLVTFSFALLQFLYQITDGIQGFFLRSNPAVSCPPECISQKDLFYWSWDYRDFIGLRKVGDANNESAYISLILTKLSAMTYYVMIGILIIRKIILWFFIIVSPIFPLLLLYYPVRNTAKIWIGEFFRWLFYAPLFAVFLAGLVSLWKQNIPLRFLGGGDGVYPTAINILLAGPQQTAQFTNSVNLTDTYALYLVALIMLWIVIILPFILLQIFLDYINTLTLRDSPGLSQVISLINKRFPPTPPVAPIPQGPASTGLARALPFRNRFQMPASTNLERQISTTANVPSSAQLSTHSEILKLTSLAVPTMRDIARFESARLQKDTVQVQELSRIRENLEKIASPQTISNSTERDRYTKIKSSLISESKMGSPMATSILKAAESLSSQSSKDTNTLKEVLRSIGKPEVVKSTEKEKYVELRERIEKESQKGNTTATTILNAANTVSQSSNSTTTNTAAIKEIIRQLASPSTISDTATRERVMGLKDQLVKEGQSGNVVAKEVLDTVEKVASESTTEQQKEQIVRELREKLLQEANKGNDLAISVLGIMGTTDSEIDIVKVIERLEKAKSNGDNLATTLLALLATKQAQEKVASQQIGIKADVPTTNRIQQVSLDDYEAVKDMWAENYQNLDVPQGLSGQQHTRKQWIEEDMQQISDTINLLSSSEEEKVAQGMEEVSNILPFLLIGGFTQGEITAYLKAKLEAGKEALKIVAVIDKEEDTLMEVNRSVKEESKTMSASSHATIQSTSPKSVFSDKEHSKSTPTIIKPQIIINVTGGREGQEILNLANITIPKMIEIAKYEAALRSGSQESQSARSILNTISHISNPNAISDPQTRAKVSTLRDLLIKESQVGNPLADSILSAAGFVDKNKAGAQNDQLGPIIQLLKKLFDPTEVKNPTDREKYIDLKRKVEEKAALGEPLSSAITQTLKRMTQDYVFGVHALFTELKNPENISDASRQETMKQIKETLLQEKKVGNSLADSILATSNAPVSMDTIITTKLALLQEKEKGNTIATQILSEFPAIPAIDIISAQNVKKLLDSTNSEKDPIAIFIRTFLLMKDDIGDDNILLPESNKLQTVSLDDYESVRKLWIENYHSSEVEDAELQNDEMGIAVAINLLTSPEKIKIEQGMEKVSSILPFLLMGGFSQSEVVSYLKAKLEAVKTVRRELAKEESTVDIRPQGEKADKTMTQAQAKEIVPDKAQ